MTDMILKMTSKYRGVVYDVGLNFAKVHDMGLNSPEGLSVDTFDLAQVDYDMCVIREKLHANAVRIEGERLDRLMSASRLAHKHGLTVFFNPWMTNASADELRPYYADAAREAETLRKEGVEICFIPGCEYSIFQTGLLAGNTVVERISSLFADVPREEAIERVRPRWVELNEILRSFVDVIRREFKGPVSYPSLALEEIDWSVFDLVGIDHYRGEESAEEYVAKLDDYSVHGKPVVCMEVGCCAYVGGAASGGGGFLLFEGVDPDGAGRFKNDDLPVRNETEQADYIETQIKLLANNGAAGIFIFVFNAPMYTHGEGMRDLDRVSYAVVKTYAQEDPRSQAMPPWAPKEAFHRIAKLFAEMDQLEVGPVETDYPVPRDR